MGGYFLQSFAQADPLGIQARERQQAREQQQQEKLTNNFLKKIDYAVRTGNSEGLQNILSSNPELSESYLGSTDYQGLTNTLIKQPEQPKSWNGMDQGQVYNYLAKNVNRGVIDDQELEYLLPKINESLGTSWNGDDLSIYSQPTPAQEPTKPSFNFDLYKAVDKIAADGVVTPRERSYFKNSFGEDINNFYQKQENSNPNIEDSYFQKNKLAKTMLNDGVLSDQEKNTWNELYPNSSPESYFQPKKNTQSKTGPKRNEKYDYDVMAALYGPGKDYSKVLTRDGYIINPDGSLWLDPKSKQPYRINPKQGEGENMFLMGYQEPDVVSGAAPSTPNQDQQENTNKSFLVRAWNRLTNPQQANTQQSYAAGEHSNSYLQPRQNYAANISTQPIQQTSQPDVVSGAAPTNGQNQEVNYQAARQLQNYFEHYIPGISHSEVIKRIQDLSKEQIKELTNNPNASKEEIIKSLRVNNISINR